MKTALRVNLSSTFSSNLVVWLVVSVSDSLIFSSIVLVFHIVLLVSYLGRFVDFFSGTRYFFWIF